MNTLTPEQLVLLKKSFDWRDAYELRNYGTPWLYGMVYFKYKPPRIIG